MLERCGLPHSCPPSLHLWLVLAFPFPAAQNNRSFWFCWEAPSGSEFPGPPTPLRVPLSCEEGETSCLEALSGFWVCLDPSGLGLTTVPGTAGAGAFGVCVYSIPASPQPPEPLSWWGQAETLDEAQLLVSVGVPGSDLSRAPPHIFRRTLSDPGPVWFARESLSLVVVGP